MAFITGIYEELITAIRSFDATVVRHLVGLRWGDAARAVKWPFLASLLTGILLAIFSLSRGIAWRVRFPCTSEDCRAHTNTASAGFLCLRYVRV